MPLYSTGTQTNAGGKDKNGADMISGAEGKMCAEPLPTTSWCYMFVHHKKMDIVSGVLTKKHYTVFVHKTIVYKRENKRIKKTEKPTISGMLFVQGDGNDIQKYLNEVFSGLYLVKDCSKGGIAVIPDNIMQPFMQVSKANPTRIRFMPHPISYYSKGNPLVRITSGVLAGLEGYRIRISRDKCLVTTLEGMTVAIGGIHKDSFENPDEYVHQRREQQKPSHVPESTFTPLQQEIDKCFFNPENQLDIMAMVGNLRQWVARMKADISGGNFEEALEIALFILEEAGHCLNTVCVNDNIGSTHDMTALCREVDTGLMAIINNTDVSSDMKETAMTGRESLVIRYPFLPIEL